MALAHIPSIHRLPVAKTLAGIQQLWSWRAHCNDIPEWCVCRVAPCTWLMARSLDTNVITIQSHHDQGWRAAQKTLTNTLSQSNKPYFLTQYLGTLWVWSESDCVAYHWSPTRERCSSTELPRLTVKGKRCPFHRQTFFCVHWFNNRVSGLPSLRFIPRSSTEWSHIPSNKTGSNWWQASRQTEITKKSTNNC